MIKRVFYLLLVAAFSFVAAGFVLVPKNAQGVVFAQIAPKTRYGLPYGLGVGLHWVDPVLNVQLYRAPYTLPSTDDFIAMARYYDVLFDAEVAKGELHNPRTQAEIEATAYDIYDYLNSIKGPYWKDFDFNGVVFFSPDPRSENKYQTELAHWARVLVGDDGKAVSEGGQYVVDNRIYINLNSFNGFLQEEDTGRASSFMALLTHEMGHGALTITIDAGLEGYMDQETINQVLVSEALRLMAEDGYPGARAALYDHLRELALFSASWRALFGKDVFTNNYYVAQVVGAQTADAARKLGHIEPGWDIPVFSIPVPDILAALKNALKGDWQAVETTNLTEKNPTMAAGLWLNRQRLLLRQYGVHFKPGLWLAELNLGDPSVARRIFGSTYAHVEWAIPGEQDRALQAREDILGRAWSAEGKEQWESYNTYFYDVWWRYHYAAIQSLLGNVYYDQGLQWLGLKSSDFNDIYKIRDFNSALRWLEPRSFQFDRETWRGLLAPLGLELVGADVGDAKCSRYVETVCVWSVENLRPFGRVGVFPGAVYAFLALLIAEALGGYVARRVDCWYWRSGWKYFWRLRRPF